MRDSRILTSRRNSRSLASNEHLFVLSTSLWYERCSLPARKKLSSLYINCPLLPFLKLIIPCKGQAVIFTLHPLRTYSNYLWRKSPPAEVLGCFIGEVAAAEMAFTQGLIREKGSSVQLLFFKTYYLLRYISEILNNLKKGGFKHPTQTNASCPFPEFHEAQLQHTYTYTHRATTHTHKQRSRRWGSTVISTKPTMLICKHMGCSSIYF